jgi:mxaJ protein
VIAMPGRSSATCFLLAVSLGSSSVTAPADAAELRVCADPNNLPYSNAAEEGFENAIAELLARDLQADLTYHWWPQRRGFVRNTLDAGDCDLLIGVPAGLELVRTTRPYYRSSYVLVSPADREPAPRSLDDPSLRSARIGVQLVGDDFANAPPVHALGARGIVGNLHGYPVYGDYGAPAPGARIVEAVARGEVDLAIVWGPIAGYFARAQPVRLELAALAETERPWPMAFDIALGVRRADIGLATLLDAALERNRAGIESILDAYAVPRLPLAEGLPPGPPAGR